MSYPVYPPTDTERALFAALHTLSGAVSEYVTTLAEALSGKAELTPAEGAALLKEHTDARDKLVASCQNAVAVMQAAYATAPGIAVPLP